MVKNKIPVKSILVLVLESPLGKPGSLSPVTSEVGIMFIYMQKLFFHMVFTLSWYCVHLSFAHALLPNHLLRGSEPF